MDHSSPAFPQPAAYYRKKAAEARRIAGGVTTRAIKERLLGLALDFDRQASGLETVRVEHPKEAE